MATRAPAPPSFLHDEADGSRLEHFVLQEEDLRAGLALGPKGEGEGASSSPFSSLEAPASASGSAPGSISDPSFPHAGSSSSSSSSSSPAARRRPPGAAGDTLAGPFFARTQDDVLAVKRMLLANERERRRSGARVRAISGSGSAEEPHARARLAEHHSHRQELDERFAALRRGYGGDGDGAAAAADAELARETRLGPFFRDERQDGSAAPVAARLERRQTQAEDECYVGNAILSCYPTADTVVVQGTWSKFIWNTYYPRFRQIGAVDVYLFRQDTDQQQTSWLSMDNNLGRLSFSPNDAWWADRPRATQLQQGQNMSWPFYFVITAAGLGIDDMGTVTRQSTFNALQTALPTSYVAAQASIASLSSAEASAASAAASLSSASAALSDSAAISSASASIVSQLSQAIESSLRSEGFSGTQTAAATATTTLPNGSVVTAYATAAANGGRLGGDGSGGRGGGGGDDGGLALPRYAIVLISVFGFLALVGALVGCYFLSRCARRRRERARDGSLGSGSPMMRGLDSTDGHGGAASSLLGGQGTATGANYAGLGAAAGAGAGAAGAAAYSRDSRSSSESHPFTTDEASRMADAFRNALRKPAFAGSAFGSPDQNSPNESDPTASAPATELLRDELASEGKDLKAVERGRPQVHTEP